MHPSGRVLTRHGLVPARPGPRRLTRAQVTRALRVLGLHGSSPRTLRLIHQGANVELEHTPDPVVAVQIALDHLAERTDYYARLKEVEEG